MGWWGSSFSYPKTMDQCTGAGYTQLCSSLCTFLKVAYSMKQLVPWVEGRIFLMHFHQSAGQTGPMGWLGFPPLKSMSQEGYGAALLFPLYSPGKFIAAWSGQHKEFFLHLPVHPSQCKQSLANHWAVMKHKLCSERIGGFSVQGVLYMQYIYYLGSLSLTIFFPLYFWMDKL